MAARTTYTWRNPPLNPTPDRNLLPFALSFSVLSVILVIRNKHRERH